MLRGNVDYLTAEEVAEHRSVSVATVYLAAREGRLPSEDVLGRMVFDRSVVDAWQPGTHGGRRPGSGRRRTEEQSADA